MGEWEHEIARSCESHVIYLNIMRCSDRGAAVLFRLLLIKYHPIQFVGEGTLSSPIFEFNHNLL